MNRREAFKNTALLYGLSISGAALTSFFTSCQKQKRLDWKPVFFTEDQARNISALTEAILPKTDTPGALDLKIDLFVDRMMKETLSPSNQKHVLSGYDRFVKSTSDMYDRPFYQLDTSEQQKILEILGKESNKFNMSIWGSTIGEQAPLDFYRRVKQFTLIGYYTSEQVGKNVLVYDPVPGQQKGCIPLSDVGNSWTF